LYLKQYVIGLRPMWGGEGDLTLETAMLTDCQASQAAAQTYRSLFLSWPSSHSDYFRKRFVTHPGAAGLTTDNVPIIHT
jgi:hypothetical protein